MRIRAIAFSPLLVVGLVAFATACSNGNGAGGEETPTVATQANGSPTAPPDIRSVDFSTNKVMQRYLESAGGEIDPSMILYGDLTQDGVEDAVVPVSSGGESGPIAIYVFAYGEGGLAALLDVKPQGSTIQAAIENGQLVTTEPVFGASDPLCCPSQLLKRTFGWDGLDMVQLGSETVAATPTGAGG